MAFTPNERKMIGKLVDDSMESFVNPGATETEGVPVKDLLKTKAELEAIQQREKNLTQQEESRLRVALSFVTSVIDEKNALSRPKVATRSVESRPKVPTSLDFAGKKKLVESALRGRLKEPEKAPVAPVSGLPSYEQAIAKPTAKSSKQQDWRARAQKSVDSRGKMLDEYRKKLNEKGINDDSIIRALKAAEENFRSMRKIIASTPSLVDEQIFNNSVKQFDKNILKVMNMAHLEELPNPQPILMSKKHPEPKSSTATSKPQQKDKNRPVRVAMEPLYDEHRLLSENDAHDMELEMERRLQNKLQDIILLSLIFDIGKNIDARALKQKLDKKASIKKMETAAEDLHLLLIGASGEYTNEKCKAILKKFDKAEKEFDTLLRKFEADERKALKKDVAPEDKPKISRKL